jgi:hypothetical protein
MVQITRHTLVPVTSVIHSFVTLAWCHISILLCHTSIPRCALCQEAREMDLREGEGRPVGEGPSGGLPLTEPPVAM